MADDRPVETPEEMLARVAREFADFKATVINRLGMGMTGDIEPTLRSTAKPGTLILNGQTVNRADYPGLWQWAQDQSAVATGRFGSGNGTTTFTVPDWRGRFLVGVGQLGSDTYTIGQTGGSSTVTLTTNQMPSHDHTGSTNNTGSHAGHRSGDLGTTAAPGSSYHITSDYLTTGNHTHSLDINATGGGQAHENKPPWMAVNWLVWT